MQPSLNNPVSAPHRKIQERLRHDQLHVIRFLLAFGAIVLLLGLFRARWPQWMVLSACGLGTACLSLGAFFVGRFQIGQEAVLALGGIAPAGGSAFTPTRLTASDQVKAYASLDEARSIGWTFYEPFGQYGAHPIPRWAHDGTTWFEYNGLDGRMGVGLTEDERLFGAFAYRKADTAPGAHDQLLAINEVVSPLPA
jgi:hypothetical protein